MSISVTCQACGSDFRVSDKHAGKRFACRNCRAPLIVPQPDELGLADLGDDRPAASARDPVPARPRADVAAGRASTERPREPTREPSPVPPVSRRSEPAKDDSPPRESPQAIKPGQVVAACDGCGHRTTVGAELVGRRVRCKKCGQVFRIAATANPAANPDLAAFAASAPRPVSTAPPQSARPRPAAAPSAAPRSTPSLRPHAAGVEPPAARPAVARAAEPEILDVLSIVDEAAQPALPPLTLPARPFASTPLPPATKPRRWRRNIPLSQAMSNGMTVATLILLVVCAILLAFVWGQFGFVSAVIVLGEIIFVCRMACFVGALVQMFRNGAALLGAGIIVVTPCCCFGAFFPLALIGPNVFGALSFLFVFFLGEFIALCLAIGNADDWKMGPIPKIWGGGWMLQICALLAAFVYGFFNPEVRQEIAARNQVRQWFAELAPDSSSDPQAQRVAQQPSSREDLGDSAESESRIDLAELEKQTGDALEKELVLLKSVVDEATAKTSAEMYAAIRKERESLEKRRFARRGATIGGNGRELGAQMNRKRRLEERITFEENRIKEAPAVFLALASKLPLDQQPLPDEIAKSGPRESRTRPRIPGKSPPPNRPAPTSPEEEVDQLLADLAEASHFERRELLQKLRKMPPNGRRDEVSKVLVVMLDDSDTFTVREVIDTLGVWGAAECVPALISRLDDRGWDGEHAMRALGKLKDPRGARAVAKKLLTWDAQKALAALREMGPVAEDAVLVYLHHDDPKMRGEMCVLLEDIGTAKSLPELKKHFSDNVKEVRRAAKQSHAAIESRIGASCASADESKSPPSCDGPAPPATKTAPGSSPATKSGTPKALKPVPR